MGGLRHGPKIYRLSRTATQKWHLMRTLATQLVEHERIRTTLAKCKALKPIADKLLASAKKCPNDLNSKKKIQMLTTSYAQSKIVNEIAPRLTERQRDNAKIAYIEYVENDIEKYEKALEKQKLKNKNPKSWNESVLMEEKEKFQKLLEESEKKLAQHFVEDKNNSKNGNYEINLYGKMSLNEMISFYKSKIEKVEYDLNLLNKDPYDLIKFPKYK